MSPHEKRYLKRHYCNPSNLLTKLYDYVNYNKVNNDETIKNHFKNELLAKNLKVYKVQLKELILKSLHSIDYKRSVKNKINIGVLEIDVLIKKRLFNLAWLQIQKLKKLCHEYESYEQQLTLICIEEKMKASRCIYKLPSESPINEKSEILKKLTFITQIKELTEKLKSPDVLNQKLTTPNLNEGELELVLSLKQREEGGFKTQFYANECLAQYYLNIENRPEQSLLCLQKNVELLHNFKHMIDADPFIEGQINLNLLNLLSWQKGQKVAAQQLINEIKNRLAKDNEFDFFKLPLYHYETRLNYFNNDYQKVIQNEENINNWLDKNGLTENCEAFPMYLYLCLSFLWTNKSKETFLYLQKMFAFNKKLPAHFYSMLNIIEMVANYVFKDFDMLSYRVKSLCRYNSKANESLFFHALLEKFKEIDKAPADKHKHILDSLFNEMNNFKNEPIYQVASLFILDKWKATEQLSLGIVK